VDFKYDFETKGRGKRLSTIDREVNPYDSCLSEKTVTLECAQFQALMASKNVQGGFNKQQAIIVESKSFPFMEMT
jgi:hypothetical protein